MNTQPANAMQSTENPNEIFCWLSIDFGVHAISKGFCNARACVCIWLVSKPLRTNNDTNTTEKWWWGAAATFTQSTDTRFHGCCFVFIFSFFVRHLFCFQHVERIRYSYFCVILSLLAFAVVHTAHTVREALRTTWVARENSCSTCRTQNILSIQLRKHTPGDRNKIGKMCRERTVAAQRHHTRCLMLAAAAKAICDIRLRVWPLICSI